MDIVITTLRRVSPCWRCLTGSMLNGSCVSCGAEPLEQVPQVILDSLTDRVGRLRNPSTSYKGAKVRL